MDPASAIDVAKEAIYVLLKIATPLMLVTLVVGLIISLFQALTQIQEMTLSFVPKIIAMFFSLILLLPFIGDQMSVLTQNLAARIVASGGGF